MQNIFTAKRLVRGAVIAAVYAVLTLVLAPMSYGPFQLRFSEALCILPLFLPEAVPGLFIGCVIANFGSNLGAFDIIFGSLFTLSAALLTWKLRGKPAWIALLPPVLINAFGVGALLYFMADAPYWITSMWVGLGQFAAVYVIGLPIYYLIKKKYSNSGIFK